MSDESCKVHPTGNRVMRHVSIRLIKISRSGTRWLLIPDSPYYTTHAVFCKLYPKPIEAIQSYVVLWGDVCPFFNIKGP